MSERAASRSGRLSSLSSQLCSEGPGGHKDVLLGLVELPLCLCPSPRAGVSGASSSAQQGDGSEAVTVSVVFVGVVVDLVVAAERTVVVVPRTRAPAPPSRRVLVPLLLDGERSEPSHPCGVV